MIAAVRAGAELVLAGGSNVVIADEGVPGTVVLVRTRGICCDGGLLVVPAGEPWDDVVAHCVARRAGRASSACPASPARPARRRSRTSAPTGRTSPRRSRGCASTTARRDAVDDVRRRACRFDYRRASSSTATAGRCSRSRSGCPSRRCPARSLRRAGAGARRRRSAGARARRRARRRAGAAARQGHGHRPRRPGHRQRRLLLHQPDPRPRRVGARSRAPPGWPEPDGRIKTSAAWLIEQRRASRAATGADAPGSRPSTRSRWSTAATRRPPS